MANSRKKEKKALSGRGREFGVRVAEAKYGFGAYATRSFEADEPIGPVAGEVIDDPHYGSDYCMDLGDTLSLEPAAPFRFLNHSCTPNCSLVHYTGTSNDPDDHGLWIEAIADIEPGDQLTIDYAWAAVDAIPCGCGSQKCRGWIVDADEAHLLPKGKKNKKRAAAVGA